MAKILLWLLDHPPAAVAAWYVVMSLLALVLYWRDKRAAVAGKWRTPESTLHLFELLGGWPGAWIGQKVFRHKCSKMSYQVEFWFMAVLNILGLAYFTYGRLTGDWQLTVPRDWMQKTVSRGGI